MSNIADRIRNGLIPSARLSTFEPPPGGSRSVQLSILFSFAVLIAACVAISVWIEPLSRLFQPFISCHALIPKLDPAVGRFVQADVCLANLYLWSGLYTVSVSCLIAIFVPLAINPRDLTLQRVRSEPRQYLSGLIFAIFLFLTLFIIYVFSDLSFGRNSKRLLEYRELADYTSAQINRLLFGASAFTVPLIGFLSAFFRIGSWNEGTMIASRSGAD